MFQNIIIPSHYLWPMFFLLSPIQTLANDDFLSDHISSHEQIKRLLEQKHSDEQTIPICYNYGCKTRHIIDISAHNIRSLKKIFTPFDKNRYKERHAIAKAIALLEKIAATQTPVYNDKAKNYDDNGMPGRMDCIDSTVNTTHYLEFINNLGLIREHKLQKPVYRSPFLMGQHWAAQIKNRNTGQLYAVDSWQTSNGQLPVIQSIENWKNRDSPEKL